MSLRIGIIGLPNAGKSTLFNALLKKQVARVADYPFTTIEPNVGVVAVPDARLAKIAEISKVNKTIPATIEFIDIAGLVKNAHQGKGLGNQFLHHIREVDCLVHVVRAFDPEIPPEEAKKIIADELQAAGIAKPTLVVENVTGSPNKSHQVNAQTGEGINELIVETYTLLGLITFYTLKKDQVQAWPIKKGSAAPQAAGRVHTDMERGFIKAEIVNFEDFVNMGSWEKARRAGKLRIEGKDYVVADGDVILFRFNV